MSLHLGFIHQLAFRWNQSPPLSAFQTEEVVNVAFVEADRLLREKYRPSLGTVTTFLRAYLLGRVEYEMLKGLGLKKRTGGWKNAIQLDLGRLPHQAMPGDQMQLDEMISGLHPDLRRVARDLSEGRTLLEIVREIGVDHFDLYDEESGGENPEESPEEKAAEELRQMLAKSLRSIPK